MIKLKTVHKIIESNFQKKLKVALFFFFWLLYCGFFLPSAFAATKYYRNVNSDWNTNANWSTTSGGGADTTFPVDGDDVKFDANSGNCTLDAAPTCKSIDFTGYTKVFTDGSFTVTVNGNITVPNTGGLISSTGSWVQGASGNISSPANAFNSLTLAGPGKTATLTGVVYTKSLTCTGGTITDNGNNYTIGLLTSGNDAINFTNDPALDLAWLVLYFSADRNQKAISYTGDAIFTVFALADNKTLTMTGNLTLPDATIGLFKGTLDMGANNLQSANMLFYATATDTTLDLGSGIHTTGILMATTAVVGALDLASSQLSVSGGIDFSTINVTAGSSTVTLNGTAGVEVVISDGQSFNNLIINNSGTSVQLQDSLDVNGNFSLTGGTLDCNDQDQTYAGNFHLSAGTTYTPGTSRATFDGTTDNCTIRTAGNAFGYLTVNKTDSTDTVTVDSGAFTINQNFTIAEGELVLGTNAKFGSAASNWRTIQNGGSLLSSTASLTHTFAAGSTTTVNSGGTINFQGTAVGSEIKLRSSTAGTQWKLQLDSGSNSTFKYIDVQDSNATSRTATATYSIDSGNLTNWQVSGAIGVSGTIKDSQSNLPVPNATVELYNSSGALVTNGTTLTDANGNYTLSVDVATGAYTLKVTQSSLFQPYETKVNVTAGTNTQAGVSLIDPYGVVYDAVTGQVIEGATVTLYSAGGMIYQGSPQPNPQKSRVDGKYNFDVAPGTYYIGVTKDGYQDYSGANFQVTTQIVEWNVPMTPLNSQGPGDPNLPQYLAIRNTVNKTAATIGDILTYTVSITNISNTTNVTGVNLNVSLPHDFKYAESTATLDGVRLADPTNRKNPSWSLGTFNRATTKTITYRVIVGPDAKIGKNKNYASCSGQVGNANTTAGPSIANVEIKEGFASQKELVIGKVFNDENKNGIQDQSEAGIGGIAVILEDGKTVITDEYGRFSLPGVGVGTHILRVDPRLVPGGPLSKESTLKDWEKKAKIEQEKKKSGFEPLIERRTLGGWIKKNLFVKPVPEKEAVSQKETALPKSAYQPEIPRVSKFFRVFETQSTKVDVPLQLLSPEEAEKQAEKDKKETQFMLIGLADGQVGYLEANGNLQNLEDGSSEGLENEFYKDGQVKVYLKGKLKGEYLLTLRYDSTQEYQDHLFEYLDPEKYYPIYGDQSRLATDSDAQGKFYLRLERADSYMMYGNYSSEEFTQTELSKYGRTLSGAKAHLETKDFLPQPLEGEANIKLDFFRSRNKQDQRQDFLAGRGISGPYFLSRKPIIEYTQDVRLEVHDKNRSDVVLSSQNQTLDLDYEIDYDLGKITFKQPVPTQDENGDPVFIVVDYEYVPDTRQDEHYTQGVRGEIVFGEQEGADRLSKIKIGSQFIAEKKDSGKLRLYGIDATTEIFPGTRINAEWAHANDFVSKEGNAWRVEASSRLFNDKVHLQAYNSRIGPDFSNPVNVTESAVEKYGVTGEIKPWKSTSIIVDHYRNRSIQSHTFQRDTRVDAYYEKDDYILGAGYIYKEFRDERNEEQDIVSDGFRLQCGFKATADLLASLEYKFEKENEETLWRQAISTVSPRLDYRLSESDALYLRHDFTYEKTKGRERSYNANLTSVGLERRSKEGVSNYIEYGFTGQGVNSAKIGQNVDVPLTDKLALSANNSSLLSRDKNEENLGYGAKWQVTKDIFLNFLFERNKTTGDERYNHNAESITLEYQPPQGANLFGVKLEHQRQLEIDEYNLDGNLRLGLNDSLFFISRGQYQIEHDKENAQTNRCFRRAISGLAYRPVKNNRLNALAKYEFSQDTNNADQNALTDYTNHVTSIEALYDLTAQIELYAKGALKWVKEDISPTPTHSLNELASSRIRYKFNKWFDLAGLYHISNNPDGNTAKQAAQTEAGFTIFDNLRIALGWCFADYQDDDVDDEDYRANGPYLRCSFAFIEPELKRGQNSKPR
jgi:uncharacterized repeat protein (TIGR01451 family)